MEDSELHVFKTEMENESSYTYISSLSSFDKLHLQFFCIWVTSVGGSDIYTHRGNSLSLDGIDIGMQ